jgi:hypothetical protein
MKNICCCPSGSMRYRHSALRSRIPLHPCNTRDRSKLYAGKLCRRLVAANTRKEFCKRGRLSEPHPTINLPRLGQFVAWVFSQDDQDAQGSFDSEKQPASAQRKMD